MSSVIERIRPRLDDVSHDQRSARCPAHEDQRASLSIGVGREGQAREAREARE